MITDGTTDVDVDDDGAITMEMPTAPLLHSESRREGPGGDDHGVEVEPLMPAGPMHHGKVGIEGGVCHNRSRESVGTARRRQLAQP